MESRVITLQQYGANDTRYATFCKLATPQGSVSTDKEDRMFADEREYGEERL